MVSTKYVKDYRMDTETDKNGKVKRKMVYVGPYYIWNTAQEELKKLRCSYLTALAGEWIVFLGSMCFYNDISRNWYVILPYVCLILVFFFQSMAVWNLFTAKQPMHRETKDKTADRMKSSTFCGLILSAGALIGEIVACIKGVKELKVPDYLFVIATMILFVFLLYGFKASKRLTVTEQENPVAGEWKNK